MHIIYVDDELAARETFRYTVAGMPEIESLELFERGEDALAYAADNHIDAAFLDLEMPGLHGLALSQKLQEYCADVKTIFVTAYSRYALDAWMANASGFVLKPYTAAEIRGELQKCVPHPLPSQKVVIQTIPSLSLSVNGKPVYITGEKPRELFALLVEQADRGLTTGEGIAYLWPDRLNDPGTQSLFRMTYKRLATALQNAGIGHIIASSNNRRYIRVDEVDCDLYRILAGDRQAAAKFNGQYLEEYSWSEERSGQLSRMLLSSQ